MTTLAQNWLSGFKVGECRHTSSGRVYRLEKNIGPQLGVRCIGKVGEAGSKQYSSEPVQWWFPSSWESIPLVGKDTSDFPHFGLFVPWRAL